MTDRRPRFATHRELDGSNTVRPLTGQDEQFDQEADAEFWAPYGLPAPPRDRLWLLRSPWPPQTVSDLWVLI
jgi:hypothetical protein